MTKQTRNTPAACGRGRRALPAVLAPILTLAVLLAAGAAATAATIQIDTGGEGTLGTLELLFLFAFLSLAPTLLIMMTSFTRIVIVFSLLRNAIGLQQTPPNQVLIGLALALSLFIMAPVMGQINDNAIEPYKAGALTREETMQEIQTPLKVFMLKQIKAPDLNLFVSLDGGDELKEVNPEALTGLPMHVVIPAFLTSELKRAFTMGFMLYLPFLVIDMVVSSTLMSMGMVMLPPSMISLPFKLMLFVVVNGWSRVMEMLVTSFLS